jgi:hypothetical protein
VRDTQADVSTLSLADVSTLSLNYSKLIFPTIYVSLGIRTCCVLTETDKFTGVND